MSRFADILAAVCLIGLLVSFFLIWGTAGAIECDMITLETGTKRFVILVIIMALSGFGIAKLSKAEERNEDKYGGL